MVGLSETTWRDEVCRNFSAFNPHFSHQRYYLYVLCAQLSVCTTSEEMSWRNGFKLVEYTVHQVFRNNDKYFLVQQDLFLWTHLPVDKTLGQDEA